MRVRKIIVTSVVLGICGGSGAAADVLEVVAQYMQPAPGTTGNFRIFSVAERSYSPSISGNNIAFGATTQGGGGIYALLNGQLRVIADLDTHMPGTSHNFGFGLLSGSGPSISGRNVAFTAPTISQEDAIWASFDGVLTKIAGIETPVPGGMGTFSSFGTANGTEPSISGQNVVFHGWDQDTKGGIYLSSNGQLQIIANTNTLLPGATQNVTSFGAPQGVSPSISGENVAFFARWGFDGQGIYAYINGQIRIIADTGTPKPGGGTFGVFGMSPSISGENVAFSVGSGIFAYINGALELIASTSTTPPGATGPFGGLGPAVPSISGENVAFGGSAPGLGWSIFARIDGSLRVIATVDTPIPGLEPATFAHFNTFGGSSPVIDGSTVVFMGNPAPGIYASSPEGIGIISLVPAVSSWGLIALALLCTTAASVLLQRRQPAFS